jgi:fibronectin-binding autotransporter adhesin
MNSTSKTFSFTTGKAPQFIWAWLLAAFAIISCGTLARAQVTQTYSPDNWVNDPYSPDAYYTISSANTASPLYTGNSSGSIGSLYGNSPIGATITLNAPGETIAFSGTVTFGGSGNGQGNNQFRYALLYKGANLTDTGWAGYIGDDPTTGASGGTVNTYIRNIPNTGLFASSTGATTETPVNLVRAGGSFVTAATYNFMISVTYVNASQTFEEFTIQGANGYLYSGVYTNNSPATIGGFSFDQVGLFAGSTTFSSGATGDNIQYANLQVTVGNFGSSAWTNNASGNWSATGNWTNGAVANGSSFAADFSQVNLAADTTATLDSSRTIGSMVFGATSGSTHNWFLTSSGGSILTLAPQVSASASPAPKIAVNQNVATLLLPLVSSNGLTETGAGTLVLGGTNTIVGPLNLDGGELNFLSLSNLPLVSGDISSINFSNGALQWASGNTLDVSSIISSLGIPISFAGNAGFDTGANNVTLATGFGDGGMGGLTKLGAGNLTLDGSVAYGGTTEVSSGVLALGSSGSISSSTNITVLSGATFDVSALSGGLTLYNQNLSGNGTVNGNISDSSGITVGSGYAATGNAGTLTVNGSLSFNGGGTLAYGLANVTTAGSGINDLIAVSGNLDISGPTTINVSLINAAPGLGNYTLFTYGTITAGSAANLIPPLGYSVVDTGTSIELSVTHLPASLTWQGDGSLNVWDVDTTPNWTNSSGAAVDFFTGDSVTFDGTGSDNPYINIDANVSPASVTVTSSGYDFAGTGAITTGKLILAGGTSLILENNNTYNGPTVIGNSAVLQVGGPTEGGGAGALGTGPVTNNGALVFDLGQNYSVTTNIYGTGSITNIGSAGTVTLSGNISGGSMNMAGFGAMVLSGSNSYTGQTIVYSGSLHPENNHALGAGTASIVVSNAAQLYIDVGSVITNKALLLAGTGLTGDGALRAGSGGGGVTTWGGVITLSGDTQFQVDNGATLNLTNAAGITGIAGATSTNVTLGSAGGVGTITGPLKLGSGSLTIAGSGTWHIAPTNNYTGSTFINGGTLYIAAPQATNALGPISTFNPAYVTFGGGTLGVATNVTFADGLGGLTVATAANFEVPVGLTLTISNQIAGTGSITKHDSGTLVLSGSNTFSGALYIDVGSTAGDNGTVVIASSNAITDVSSPIAIRVSTGGNATFALNGTNGGITVTQNFTLPGRSPVIPGLLNIAGTNTMAGNITCSAGGSQYRFESDSGLLTLGSPGTLLTFSTSDAQTFTFQGNGSFSVAGVIADGPAPTSVAMNGNGQLTLGAVNTYSGSTTISSGTLNGTGTIAGPVNVAAGGTFAPGAPLGTLTINNSLTLAGNTLVTVNKTLLTSGQVAGLVSVAYGGTLTVTNASGTLAPGDSFQIFPATTFTGNFVAISPAPGAGLAWSFNPTNGVLSVTSTINPNRPPILTTFDGHHLGLNWPTNAGWILQVQTNNLATGLGGNWADVPGSSAVTGVTNTVNPANGSVFYRLRRPF